MKANLERNTNASLSNIPLLGLLHKVYTITLLQYTKHTQMSIYTQQQTKTV